MARLLGFSCSAAAQIWIFRWAWEDVHNAVAWITFFAFPVIVTGLWTIVNILERIEREIKQHGNS